MIDLSGKNAIVTGGSRGIGRAACLMLAQAGADVVFGYHRNVDAAQTLLDEIQQMGRTAAAVPGNLANEEDCRELFKTATVLGSLDIVVGNAGIWQRSSIEDMTPGEWRNMMAVNLDSMYHTCRLAALAMKPNRRGKIVLIGSTAGQRGEAHHAHYAATKGALIALTRSLATELGPFNINVNCVAPGWVATDMTEHVFRDQGYLRAVELTIPLRRIATPEDVAGSVLFLASELSRHVQGAVINVNGGSVLC